MGRRKRDPAAITIRVVSGGDPIEHTVPNTGGDMTIEVALKTAGVSAEACDVTVGGKVVKPTDKAKPGKLVTVSPRPRGS